MQQDKQVLATRASRVTLYAIMFWVLTVVAGALVGVFIAIEEELGIVFMALLTIAGLVAAIYYTTRIFSFSFVLAKFSNGVIILHPS